jgi:hypothetical protein
MPRQAPGKWLLPFFVISLLAWGCTPPDGGNGGGDGSPTGGGQGIPQGTYSGTLQCTETTSAVTEESEAETVLSQSSPSFQVTQAFGASGVALDSSGIPLQVGSTIPVTVDQVSVTGTVRSVNTATDWLGIISDASATVQVPGRGERVMLGVVTAIYGFSEPDTVSLVTEQVFTSNVMDGEFIKTLSECSGNLAFQP